MLSFCQQLMTSTPLQAFKLNSIDYFTETHRWGRIGHRSAEIPFQGPKRAKRTVEFEDIKKLLTNPSGEYKKRFTRFGLGNTLKWYPWTKLNVSTVKNKGTYAHTYEGRTICWTLPWNSWRMNWVPRIFPHQPEVLHQHKRPSRILLATPTAVCNWS